MDQLFIDAATRLARAWIARYDANKDGERGMMEPLPCQCQGCKGVFTRDTLLKNQGFGYLCVTCADEEMIKLRAELREVKKIVKTSRWERDQ